MAGWRAYLIISITALAITCGGQPAPKFASDRLKKPPAPGIHPRVLFNPEEVPDILHRMQTTTVGKWAWKAIQDGLAQRTNTSDTANALPGLYAELLAGNCSSEMLDAIKASDCGPSSACMTGLGSTMAYDSFSVLVTADTARAKKLANGLVTYAKIAKMYLETTKCGDAPCSQNMNFQGIYMFFADDTIGLSYDFLANVMEESQKTVVRQFIAEVTAKHFVVGNGKPCYAVTSNWVSMHQFMTTMVLSIEGEDGYDPDVLVRNTETMTNFLECGLHASGASNEGMGKNYVHAERFAAFDKRGSKLLQHPNFVNHVRHFYLNIMQPYGNSFTMVDNWGGSYNLARMYDLVAAKYFYPDDKIVDFVWRNALANMTSLAGYDAIGWPHTGNEFFEHTPMSIAIYAQDWTGPNNFTEAAQELNANLTFFCEDRGYVITRDQWGENATWFAFQWRADQRWAGGHYHPDRGVFMISAWGRTWGQYPPGDDGSDIFPFTVGNYQQSRKHSVLLADGKASAPVDWLDASVGTPAGKGEAFSDTSIATFAAANLTYAYTWAWTRYMDGFENDTFITPNDFLITPRADDWMKLTVHDLIDPISPNYAPPNLPQNCSRKAYNPMEYVFRSTMFVRGKYPYVVIVDDAKKDNSSHLWEWLMQTPNDVELIEFNATDALLMDADGPAAGGPRGLLVRVLDYTPPDDYSSVTALRHESYNLRTIGASHDNLKPHYLTNSVGGLGKRLVISTRAVLPSYKIMLYPFTSEMPLPITSYDKESKKIDIQLPEQHDSIALSMGDEGRTRLEISRLAEDGNTVLEREAFN